MNFVNTKIFTKEKARELHSLLSCWRGKSFVELDKYLIIALMRLANQNVWSLTIKKG